MGHTMGGIVAAEAQAPTTMAESPYLQQILILLAALLVFVPLSQRLRIGTVLGYLAAGVVIGPAVLGLISDVEDARRLGEFGVVFLLFAVGLEIKFERLRLFGVRAFALAAAQLVVTTAVLTVAALSFGLTPPAAFLFGASLAMSSTAVVLQLLGEHTAMGRPLGRTALAVLLVQDLAVGPLLVFVSVATVGSAGLGYALLIAAFKALAVITILFLAERTVLRPLLRLAAEARAPEVFTGATLLLVLGVGWATQRAGLSMALGAFVAGMMVADTEYRHQVAADIQPFRGLFLGLFFVAVGMTLDVELTLARGGAVAALVIGLMAIKGSLLTGLALAFGMPFGRALALGGLLSEGSEFAFVLLVFAADLGVVGSAEAQLVTVAVGLSMALVAVGTAITRHVARARIKSPRSALGKLDQEGGRLDRHVIIAGFGQVGKAVARHLAGQRVPIVVLDLHPRQVAASRERGLPVFYGDAARLDVLRAAHLDRAEALVVAIPEVEIGEQIVALAHRVRPELPIFARVPDRDSVARLKKLGASAVAIDGLTTALELAERAILVHEPATGR